MNSNFYEFVIIFIKNDKLLRIVPGDNMAFFLFYNRTGLGDDRKYNLAAPVIVKITHGKIADISGNFIRFPFLFECHLIPSQAFNLPAVKISDTLKKTAGGCTASDGNNLIFPILIKVCNKDALGQVEPVHPFSFIV